MKGPLDRTKVVVRHLPPTISQSNFVEHVDSRFSGRYRWLCFRPGKSSCSDFETLDTGAFRWHGNEKKEISGVNLQVIGIMKSIVRPINVYHKRLVYSRAYIDFNKPEDVIEFAEFFNGHIFVNEKGTQFKAVVEYAPSQRVPKPWCKKDGREGTILKDPEYLEFLEFLAKPVENLPSAEIQLERKEAERAGAPKDAPVVTPLMNYVRQKRAAKGGARITVLNGKSTRRVGGLSSRSPLSGSSKRGSEKRRTSTTMYVLRDSSKGTGSKDKSTLVPKQDDQQLSDKSVNVAAVSETLERESGGSGSAELGKKKILLLKGKEREISNVSGGSSLQQNAATPAKNVHNSFPAKNHRREGSGRIIRSILLNRETLQNQSEPRIQSSSQDRDKKPPRPPNVQSFQKDSNGTFEEKIVSNDLHTAHAEKPERRTRNKDRPDRGVWTPLRRSEGSHASDELLSSSTSQTSQVLDSAEGTQLETKHDVVVARGSEFRNTGSGRNSYYSVDNGSYRHSSRRSSSYNKDADGFSVIEGKPSKRGGSGYGSNEKQVWVQKSSSGS